MVRKIFILLSFLLFPLLLQAQLEGKVTWVFDGDTFKAKTDSLGEIKIRIADIDCPEYNQDYGQEAKRLLIDLIWKKQVLLFISGKDRYGRYIATVFLDTLNINKQLLREGLAWHYKKYSSNPELAALEEEARKQKQGLWKNLEAVPPWEWRRR